MITLNGERGLEQIESWQQILELPGFTAELNPYEKVLKEVIGRYVFADKISCGLSTCKQPHGRGYIVITKTGDVTNIGNICGKNHFGIQFDEYSKAFTQRVTDYQNRELIASYLFRLEGYLSDIADIRAQANGADWVYKTTRALVERNHGCPDSLVSAINKMVRNRTSQIMVPRVASEEEVKKMEAMFNRSLSRPQYIDEVKGDLAGVAALFQEYNIREILVLDVEPGLEGAQALDVDAASPKDLRYWSRWFHDLDAKIDLVRESVRLGRLLLQRENLAQLSALILEPKEVPTYKQWIAGVVK